MRWLIDFSVRRPVAVAMVYCALALLAWAAWLDLPVDVVPDGSYPEVSVTTTWPGASPESVQSLVTSPIEAIAVTIPGVHKVTSRSARGRSTVTVELREDANLDLAGFELGDVLAAFNGVGTTEGEEMVNAEVKRSMTPGNTITITVLRRSRPVDLEVTLGRIPDYLLAQWIGYHMLEGHGEDAVAETPRP